MALPMISRNVISRNDTELGAGTAGLLAGGIAAVGWGALLLLAAVVVHLGHNPGWGGFELAVFSLFGFPIPVALAAAGAASGGGADGRTRDLRLAVRWGMAATALCAAALVMLVVQSGVG